MSCTVALLGVGLSHLAGVLGGLDAAALVAPEAPHRWCVLQGQPRRGGVARRGARRSVEVLSGLFLVNGQPLTTFTLCAVLTGQPKSG